MYRKLQVPLTLQTPVPFNCSLYISKILYIVIKKLKLHFFQNIPQLFSTSAIYFFPKYMHILFHFTLKKYIHPILT